MSNENPVLTVGTTPPETITSEQTTMPTFATDETTDTTNGLFFFCLICVTKSLQYGNYTAYLFATLRSCGFIAYVGFVVTMTIAGC